jgi:hypothetical protein
MAEIRVMRDGSAVVRIPASEGLRLPRTHGTKKAKAIQTKDGLLISTQQVSQKDKVMRAYEMNARRFDKVMRDLAK